MLGVGNYLTPFFIWRIMKFKREHKDAVAPTRAEPGAAGYDLTSVSIRETDQYVEHDTGIAVQLHPGYVGF